MVVEQELNLVAVPGFSHKASFPLAFFALAFLSSVIYVQK